MTGPERGARAPSTTVCCGPYRVLSFEAAAAMRAYGFTVRRFDGGFPERKVAGLPIETAA
jgi:ArsR family transcriptional regulator